MYILTVSSLSREKQQPTYASACIWRLIRGIRNGIKQDFWSVTKTCLSYCVNSLTAVSNFLRGRFYREHEPMVVNFYHVILCRNSLPFSCSFKLFSPDLFKFRGMCMKTLVAFSYASHTFICIINLFNSTSLLIFFSIYTACWSWCESLESH